MKTSPEWNLLSNYLSDFQLVQNLARELLKNVFCYYYVALFTRRSIRIYRNGPVWNNLGSDLFSERTHFLSWLNLFSIKLLEISYVNWTHWQVVFQLAFVFISRVSMGFWNIHFQLHPFMAFDPFMALFWYCDSFS